MERNHVMVVTALLCGLCTVANAQPATAPVPTPRFDIHRFEIVGNTLVATDVAEGAVAPFTGKQKDFGDIQRALAALERVYRERGYGVVNIVLPEMDITQGVVRLIVVQPKIGRVTLEGNRHFDEPNIRRSLPAIKEGETPNARNVARNLQMIGEHPGKQANVVLRAGAKEGEIDVNVKVTEEARPYRVMFTLDDSGTGDTGYWRAGVSYQHNNLFNRDHTLTAQYITSPTHLDKVSVYGLGYRAPYYRLNSSFELFAGYSDVNSGMVQGLFNVSGSGAVFGARWNYYLPKWDDVEQKLTLGLDYRAFRNEVLLAGQSLVPDITIHPASLTYSGSLRAAASELRFHAGASANLPGGNDGRDADFARSRAGASASYTILRYGASHVHAFTNEWQTRATFSAQHTRDALVSGEQFGIGGPDSVRGYLLREVTNDKGYFSQLELYTPNLSAKMGLGENFRSRLLAFYDFGGVRRNKALAGEQEGKSIASVGIGVRASYAKNVIVRLDLAQILKAAGTRQTDDKRVSMSIALVY